MLAIVGLDAFHDALQVLHGVTLSVRAGERLAIFGHNGAGKTTLLRCVLGQHVSCRGEIRFDGAPILPGQVHQNARRGIGFVPQGHNVFRELSIDRNLRISGLLHGGRMLSEVFGLFPLLAERRAQIAGSLSGGQQQMLALGMALMTEPRLLLLDEPATGLAPIIVRTVMTQLAEVNRRLGMTLVIVEQNIPATLQLAERAVVLKSGSVVADMPAAELAARAELWDLF